mgnify:CR=1 FL=1
MKHGLQASEVLRELAPGQAVSGEALAARLGVTRAAVWKQVAALREMGLPIEARTGAGYRLPWPMQLLDAARIQAEWGGAGSAPVQLYWELDSTQDELARHLSAAPDLTVVLAERQTLGRGRRGRAWCSPPGLGIYLSCLKRFSGSPAALSGLSIAVGVGLNVRLPLDVRAGLDQPATDLATLCDGAPPDRNRLAARLIERLRAGLLRFEHEGLAPFAKDFARLDRLAGQPLTVYGPHGMQPGVGCGIDARGALRVEMGGRITAVHSGEVSVRAG